MLGGRCKLCGALFSENRLSLKGTVTLVCDDCMYEVASNLPDVVGNKQFDYACDALDWHFAGIPRDQLVSTSRQFPGHMRADVQTALDRLFSVSPIRFFGIHEDYRYETLTLAALCRGGRNAQAIAPAQYHDVDVGENAPMQVSQQRLVALPNRRPALRGRALHASRNTAGVRDPDRDRRARRR